MGCNCGKKSSGVRAARTVTGTSGDTVTRAAGTRMRTHVQFFVVPPPEDHDSEEKAYTTLYAARAALTHLPGWRLESRRVEV